LLGVPREEKGEEEEGQGPREASRLHFLAFPQGVVVGGGGGEGGDQVQQQEEQEELGKGRVRERCVILCIFSRVHKCLVGR